MGGPGALALGQVCRGGGGVVTPFPFSCYVNTLRTGICGNCKGVDSCSQGLVFFPCSLLEEDSEEEGDMCRICQIAGGSPTNPLLEPCGCVGSLQFVHQECLKKWLKVKITSGRRGRKSSQLMTNTIGGTSGRGSAWTAPPSPPGACSSTLIRSPAAAAPADRYDR